MRTLATVLALACLACIPAGSAAPADLRLWGFAPNLPGINGDDAFAVWNPGPEPVALDAVEVEDNQGRLGFPPGAILPAQSYRVAAVNATAYAEAARRAPDFAVHGLPLDRTLRVLRQGFALAQDGDRLALYANGTLLDLVAYGSTSTPDTGWTGPPVRVDGRTFLRWVERQRPTDHDTAADWDSPRRAYLGQSGPPPQPVVLEGRVVAFTAPEHSRRILLDTLQSAQQSLRVNVYEFRDQGVSAHLVQHLRAHPNLTARVLLDEQPVGTTREEHSATQHIIRDLSEAGATVRRLQHERYAFNHAKYVIADEAAVLVQTENFVPGGVPADGISGNRGWGLLVESPALARMLARVFDDDFELDPYGAREPGHDPPEYPRPLAGSANPAASGPGWIVASAVGSHATLLVSPTGPLGADDPILAALQSATRTVRIQHLNLPPVWADAAGRQWPNAYLEAALAAARRGVDVRILLDGHFVEPGGRLDNADTVRLVNDGSEGLRLEARLAGGEAPVQHVKGLVVDERWTALGSMNWNLHSIVQNREVSIVLDDTTVASFFADTFDEDWAATAPDDSGLIPHPAAFAIIIIWGLLGAAQRRRGHPK